MKKSLLLMFFVLVIACTKSERVGEFDSTLFYDQTLGITQLKLLDKEISISKGKDFEQLISGVQKMKNLEKEIVQMQSSALGQSEKEILEKKIAEFNALKKKFQEENKIVNEDAQKQKKEGGKSDVENIKKVLENFRLEKGFDRMVDVSSKSEENGFGEFAESKQQIGSIKSREDITKEFIEFYNSKNN